MTPERATAALTTSALATMMTMSSLKPLKALIRRHDADDDRGKQRQHGDEVVAPAAPGEQRHHGDDDGEGEALIERHRARARARRVGSEKHIGETISVGWMVRHRESDKTAASVPAAM